MQVARPLLSVCLLVFWKRVGVSGRVVLGHRSRREAPLLLGVSALPFTALCWSRAERYCTTCCPWGVVWQQWPEGSCVDGWVCRLSWWHSEGH